jgi:hypothetical protein
MQKYPRRIGLFTFSVTRINLTFKYDNLWHDLEQYSSQNESHDGEGRREESGGSRSISGGRHVGSQLARVGENTISATESLGGDLGRRGA